MKPCTCMICGKELPLGERYLCGNPECIQKIQEAYESAMRGGGRGEDK